MLRFLRPRVLIVTLLACLLLALSFTVFTPKAFAVPCRFGITKACVKAIPNPVTSHGGCITFKAIGAHWPASDTITLSVTNTGSFNHHLGSVTADSFGNFSLPVPSLCGVSPGTYTLRGADMLQGISSTANFAVH